MSLRGFVREGNRYETASVLWCRGMNKLRVKCVKCGREWEKDSVVLWGPEDFSSSFCNACFIEIASSVIHKKQLREGNFDCFGKAGEYCDQLGCKYRRWCLRLEEAAQRRRRMDDRGPRQESPRVYLG